jgi:hypothetical protein
MAITLSKLTESAIFQAACAPLGIADAESSHAIKIARSPNHAAAFTCLAVVEAH